MRQTARFGRNGPPDRLKQRGAQGSSTMSSLIDRIRRGCPRCSDEPPDRRAASDREAGDGQGKGPGQPAVGGDRSPESASVNQRYFDGVAEGYDHRFHLSLEGARARARFIRAQAQLPLPARRALDLGCGTGNLTMALIVERLAEQCVGLDISGKMIALAREKARAFPQCGFIEGSATQLPFPNASFDVCVGDAVLHHLVRVQDCLSEVFRVLTPQGFASCNEPSRDGYAFFELIIRSIADSLRRRDRSLDNYLDFLRFVREHEGDEAALEAYPLPDKHVFSVSTLESLACRTGFRSIKVVPALDPYPGLWPQAFQTVLTEIRAGAEASRLLLQAAHRVESILGDVARQHFCLHQQVFFYKDTLPRGGP